MNIDEKLDLRIEKTLGIIRKTFEEMLLEIDYEKITVSNLCTKAKINRKTFYRYYPTIDHLLGELQINISSEYIERTKHIKYPQEQDKAIREFILYSASKGELYDKITCSGNFQYIRNKMIGNVMSNTWEKSKSILEMDEYKRNIFTAYTTASGLEIYKQWVLDGKKLPVEELAEMAVQLICQGTYGFCANNKLY